MENIPCGSCGRPTFVSDRCADCEFTRYFESREEPVVDPVVGGDHYNAKLVSDFVALIKLLNLELPANFMEHAGYALYRFLSGDPEWLDYALSFEDGCFAEDYAVYLTCSDELRANEDVRFLAARLAHAYWHEGDCLEDYTDYRISLREWLASWLECQPGEFQEPEDSGPFGNDDGGHADCPPNCMKCNPTFGMTHGTVTKVAKSDLRRWEREDKLPHGELTREHKARRQRTRVHGYSHPG